MPILYYFCFYKNSNCILVEHPLINKLLILLNIAVINKGLEKLFCKPLLQDYYAFRSFCLILKISELVVRLSVEAGNIVQADGLHFRQMKSALSNIPASTTHM